jgi:hypothetical protein
MVTDKSSSIHGIHYEVSKPVLNRVDGYFYQRVRQVDGAGNLVGVGEQIHRSANPRSKDGLFARPIDLAKLGVLAMDAGQTVFGGIAGDVRTAAIGATKFGRDVAGGVTDDYKSWPGTHKPWEPILDWRTGSSGVDFVQDGGPGGIGDGRGIGNWREHPQTVSRNQPRGDRWASIPVPDFSQPPLPSALGPAGTDATNAGWPAPSPPTGTSRANGGLPPLRVLDTGASPIPYLPVASQQAPRGLPALLAEVGAFDLSNPEAPPSGGLPGLIQEYLRNR